MAQEKSDIKAQLQKIILPLQGLKAISGTEHSIPLGIMNRSFPNGAFPLAAVHEFFIGSQEDAAATFGFISGILSWLMQYGGPIIWISSCRNIFPPALARLGIAVERIIFIDLKRERDVIWAMEEALKCNGLAAVIAESSELSFTNSRRLQLAVEQSRVTGFVIRRNPVNLSTTCVTRWKITSSPSLSINQLPGIGYPCWNVELLKVRNGKPDNWEVAWRNEQIMIVNRSSTTISVVEKQIKKAG